MTRLIVLIAALYIGNLSATAQESLAIGVVRQASESGATKVALPEPKDNAAPSFDEETDRDLFYGRITQEQEQNIIDRAYPLLAAKWPFNKVFVCWESMVPEEAHGREVVRQAIAQTWEQSSALEFLGWGACQANSGGIRISVEDAGPHVKYLGKYLNGVKNGMVLNFTYQNWSTSCQGREDYCSRVIAVHEFGHAIGFAHEQNRPDTPGECDMAPQGDDGDTLLTPWDKYSVMNYCNDRYVNDGYLSEFDILSVRYIYGE